MGIEFSWRLRQARRVSLFGGALLLVASAAGGPSFAVRRAAALNFNSLLELRSPGDRAIAELAKVKARLAAVAPERSARVLNRVRQPAPAAATVPASPGPTVLAPTEPLFARTPDVAPETSGVDNPAGPSMAGAPVGMPGNGLGSPGIGGGGGFIGVPSGEQPAPKPEVGTELVPSPVANVPEPATWLMLIVGFGAIGWRLRRMFNKGAGSACSGAL